MLQFYAFAVPSPLPVRIRRLWGLKATRFPETGFAAS
jgi:hypothetical protein